MAESWVQFVAERSSELWLRTGEHVILTGVATGLAILAGIPLGMAASRVKALRGWVLGAVGILQTVPSLAMLVILLALMNKIGKLPAIVALTLYALLPIVRNTLTGLEGVARDVMEAARGIGMTDRQRLWMVQMPLAMPVMIAGIRTAAVVGVGIATLSAFIGAGGLGQFINRGLALSNTRLILLGAIPAALLALIVDFSIGAAEWGMRPTRQKERGRMKAKLKPVALVLPFVVVALGLAAYFARPAINGSSGNGDDATATTIRIGTKNFTEQFIIGELMAQLIEAQPDLNVERRFNLGGTMICHGALTRDEIDVYPEYTGTALTAILKQNVSSDPGQVFQTVSKAYREKFGAEWLKPFGFNNTYAITVRWADAQQHGWKTISDLAKDAPHLSAGFTAEFSERPDGYPGLRKAYGFQFGEVRDLDPSLMYGAIVRDEVEVICAFATDGRIAAYKLQPLDDDRRFFPPYQAAPVVRRAILQKYPEVGEALAPLAGLLDDATMQKLNYEVDGKKRSPRDVAHGFLVEHQLLKEKGSKGAN